MLQNYKWTMKITGSFADLLIPNTLRQKVPLMNLGLCEKRIPWLELRWWSGCFTGNLLVLAW